MGPVETLEFGNNGYVHDLNCGDGFMGVSYAKMYQVIHFKYGQFIVYQL